MSEVRTFRAANTEADAALDRLALAHQGGDAGALEALYRAMAHDRRWALARVRGRLLMAPSLELADLEQETWLALAEAARSWQPGGEPFRVVGLRAVRTALQRCVRRNRGVAPPPISTATTSPVGDSRLPWADQVADSSADSDATRWNDGVLARDVATRLPRAERQALLRHAVAEQPITRVAEALGLTRRGTERLLERAHLHARALAGIAPPAHTLEGTVLTAVKAGVDPESGRVPPIGWIMTESGLGRRRVRLTLRRLVQLGYLRPRGLRWYLRGPGDTTHSQPTTT